MSTYNIYSYNRNYNYHNLVEKPKNRYDIISILNNYSESNKLIKNSKKHFSILEDYISDLDDFINTLGIEFLDSNDTREYVKLYLNKVDYYLLNYIDDLYKLEGNSKYYSVKKNDLCYKTTDNKVIYINVKDLEISDDFFPKDSLENFEMFCKELYEILIDYIINIRLNSTYMTNYNYDDFNNIIDDKLKFVYRKIKIKKLNDRS